MVTEAGQQGTVLIRVPAETREQLLAVRQRKYPGSEYNTEVESLGGVVTRLAQEEADRQQKKAGAAAGKVNKPKRRRRPGKHRARRRATAKGKGKAKAKPKARRRRKGAKR